MGLSSSLRTRRSTSATSPTHLVRSYAKPAADAARRHPQLDAKRLYWVAIREDLIDEGNVFVLQEVRGTLAADHDPKVQAMSRLPRGGASIPSSL
jgi:hypothetical protein